MSLTPLELAKAHLRVEHDSEDAVIQVFIDSAEDSVNKYCDREEPFEAFPDAVQSAVLLIVGNLYENREKYITTMSSSKLNDATNIIVNLINKYSK